MPPFAGVTLAELGRALRAGETDAVALTARALEAAHRAQPELNAFVTLDDDAALAAAARLRDELAAGRDRGPLHGIPVAVKDMVETAGLRTTMGSLHFAEHVPARDATVVVRLREAGAVVIGKTTTHEFAYGPTGDRSANGPCRNPRDPSRMAGGSSAGSAAAVAAGLVPLALGTDTGGSVRIPAALCGVAGLRPSAGRLPLDGVFPLSPSLDAAGPLAGGVADLAIAWAALRGGETGDATPGAGLRGGETGDAKPGAAAAGGTPAGGGGAGAAEGLRSVAGLRVGLPAAPWFDRLDAAVAEPLDALVQGLAEAGADVRAFAVPDAEELAEVYRAVQSAEAVAVHAERMAHAPELFDPEVLERLHAAAAVTQQAYEPARDRLHELRAGAAARLGDCDLLLLPTVPVLAPPLGARAAQGGWASVREALLGLTSPWSVLGLPSLSLPLAVAGLPAGAQLVGRPGGDDALLAAALAVELTAARARG